MKKYFITGLIALIVSISTQSQSVSENELLKAAKNFLYERISGKQNIDYENLTPHLTETFDKFSQLNIINFKPSGYVILSSKKNHPPYNWLFFNRSFFR